MQIKDLPINSWVMDKNTIINGAPVKWKILNRNHIGYPANTTTLIGVINPNNKYIVRPEGYYNNSTKTSFVDFNSNIGGVVRTIKQSIEEVYSLFSKGFKGKIVDTPLDIPYTGSYTSGMPWTRKEIHKVFLFGAGEMYKGGGSGSLNPPSTQKYFPALSAYTHVGIGTYLGLDRLSQVMSRDIYNSSSAYHTGQPGYMYLQGNSYVSNPLMDLILAPMVNVSNDTMVSGQDANGVYLLEVSEKRYLIQSGDKLYKLDPVDGGLIEMAETVLTKELFLTHGMTDLSSIPEAAWAEIEGDFEILCFKEEASPLQVKVTTETLYDSENKRYAGTGSLKVDEIDLPIGATGFMIQAMSEGTIFKVSRDGVELGEKEAGQLHPIEGGAKLELFAEMTSGSIDAVALLWV